MLAAVPALLALACFGPVFTPDTLAYLDYAAQLAAGSLPRGEALLRSGPMPATLFRTPGLPALLVGLQWLARPRSLPPHPSATCGPGAIIPARC